MTLIEIQITNWEKFNPKRDQNSYSWLRLNNDFLDDQRLYDLSPEQKLTWVAILCLASKSNKSKVILNISYISDRVGVKNNDIVKAIDIFIERGLATAGDRGLSRGDRRLPLRDERTNERTNDIAQSFDFAEIYALFPKKIGKSKGIAFCRRSIKTLDDFEALKSSVIRYRDHVAKEGTETKFIKHFSTFMNSWRDWLDPDVGSSTVRANNEPDLSGINWSGN